MNGHQKLQEIFNDLIRIGKWMSAESEKRTSDDDAKQLFREGQAKLERLHEDFKSISLTSSERMHSGILNKCLKKFIESCRAGAIGRLKRAERLSNEAQILGARYVEVIRR
ncbi:MAG: hypothetical protein ACQEU4_07545 [Bacillota bacterium]